MQPQNQTQKRVGITLGILVILGVLYVNIFWGKEPSIISSASSSTSSNNNPNTTSVPGTTPSTIPSTSPTTPTIPQNPPIDSTKKAITTSLYRDGTYSATGSYMSPGGEDQIGVTVTLKNDIITSVSITEEPGDNTSARYQDKFASGYQTYVLGKNIANVNLTRVSGSSLTPQGFNDALAQIKSQARA